MTSGNASMHHMATIGYANALGARETYVLDHPSKSRHKYRIRKYFRHRALVHHRHRKQSLIVKAQNNAHSLLASIRSII